MEFPTVCIFSRKRNTFSELREKIIGKTSVINLLWNNLIFLFFQDCKEEKFTILAELRKCGLTDTETCLKSVTLNMNKGQTVRMQNSTIKIQAEKKLELNESRSCISLSGFQHMWWVDDVFNQVKRCGFCYESQISCKSGFVEFH